MYITYTSYTNTVQKDASLIFKWRENLNTFDSILSSKTQISNSMCFIGGDASHTVFLNYSFTYFSMDFKKFKNIFSVR